MSIIAGRLLANVPYSWVVADSDLLPRRAQRRETPSKGDLRERALLDAARRLLEQGTFADVSVAEIAQEAHISRAAFYFYFASKQSLLASLVDQAVTDFNSFIVGVGEANDAVGPAEAIRSTVVAAAQLWWNNSTVLRASVELGAVMPEVYARTIENLEIVRAPTVALLRKYGTVPEARSAEQSAELVRVLTFMAERSLYDLMRGHPTERDRDRLVDQLTTVWLRAFGIDDSAS